MPDDNSLILRAFVSWDGIGFKPLRALFPLTCSDLGFEF